MATIPRLNRVQPTTALPSANNRINMQVQDKSSLITNQTSQLVGVGDKVGDIYQQYENDKIDTLSTAAAQKYKAWNDDELNKLKSYDGDPTKAYVDYDKRAKEKYDEIIGENSDVSERVQRHVTSRFNSVYGAENIAANKQRGMQQEVYDNNMFESSVKMKKDNLPVVAGYIKKNDPSSFAMVDQGLHDIKTTIVRRGLRKGTVTQLPDDAKEGVSHMFQDDDGKVIKVSMSPMAKLRVAKDQSEAVTNSVNALLAGGQVEEAKMMRDKYKDLIDPVNGSKLEKKFTATGNKDEAYKVINSVKLTKQDIDSVKNITDDDKREAALKALKDDRILSAIENHSDPAVRSEAIKIKHSDDSKLQSLKATKSKQFYEAAASYVLDKQKDGDNPAFHGVADLENDTVYKGMVDHLDAKGRQAIEQMIEAPKVTNDKALTKVHALFNGETDVDLSTVSTEQFHHDYLTGLSKSDRNWAVKQFDKMKSPSFAEQRMAIKSTNNYMKEELFKSGLIDLTDSNQVTGDDKEILMEAQSKVRDHLSTLKVRPSEDQIRKLAKEYAASVLEERAFRPQSVTGAKKAAPAGNGGQAPTPTTTINKNAKDLDPNDVLKNLTPSQVVNLKNDFARKNNGQMPLKSNPEFLRYVQLNYKG